MRCVRARSIRALDAFPFESRRCCEMKMVITLVVVVLYILALFYLLMGALGFGLRIGGNIYAEEGFGSLRATYLVLLVLLACGGLYFLWRITRRSV